MMFLLRQYTSYATSFKPCKAFHLGVPLGELAFEEEGARRDVILVQSVAAGLGGDIDFGGLQLTLFLNVVFGDLVGTMARWIHD